MRWLWFLLCVPLALATSFGEYAFWFPDVPDHVVLDPCTPLTQPVFLTPAAASKPGFAQGITHAVSAVEHFKTARLWALAQSAPAFRNQVNLGWHVAASIHCHHHALLGLQAAIDAVDANWAALDAGIADIQFMGVADQGPTGRVNDALREARTHIETRDATTPSLGSALVRALEKTQMAVDAPLRSREAAVQLIGPKGLLEAQINAVNDIQEAIDRVEDQYRMQNDAVTQRLQDARRLKEQVDGEKLFLVPEHAFRVASASFTQTGTVQTFPQLYLQGQHGIQDGAEEQKQAKQTWTEKEREFGARTLSYLDAARQHADAAAVALKTVKSQGETLEKNLLQAVATRAAQLERQQSDDAVLEFRRIQALDQSRQPLAGTQGERILQLARAHEKLEDVQHRFQTPVDQTQIRHELDGVRDVMARAATDGVPLAAEKQALHALESLGENVKDADAFTHQIDALTEHVIAATQAKFASLPDRAAALSAYEPYIAAPQELGPDLNWPTAIGTLALTEKEIAKLEDTVKKNKRTWLLEHLEKNRRVHVTTAPVRADRPSTQTIEVIYANTLDFGDKNPLFLKWPEEIPKDATPVHADAGLRVLSGTLLLQGVEPRTQYAATFQVTTTPVRTLSWSEKTRHATQHRVTRDVTWTFSSDLEQHVQLEHDFGFDVTHVTGLSQASTQDGVLYAVVPAAKGKNTVTFSYGVERPVILTKHADDGLWGYRVQNTLPFDYAAFIEFQETATCPLTSTDFLVAEPGKDIRIFSANVTLKAREEKTLYAQLECPEESLSNQTQALLGFSSWSTDQQRVLKEAQDALTQGRADEAAWWLFQLQNPVAEPDALAHARELAAASEAAQAFLSSAQNAWQRGDKAAAQQLIQQMEDHVKKEKTLLENQLDALCTQCPKTVHALRAEAENFLFTGQLQKAKDALLRARQALDAHESAQAKKQEALHAALEDADALDLPQLEAFSKAFDVPSSIVNWRGRQPNYQSAKKNRDALEKKIIQVAKNRQQAAEGKEVTAESIRLALDGAQQDAEKLDADLAHARKNAEDAVEVAQKAVQQFGSDADKKALQEAQEAMNENRFALAQYAAEQVTARVQKNPASASLLAEPGTVAVGVGALVVLGALAYHFRKPEQPLEEL